METPKPESPSFCVFLYALRVIVRSYPLGLFVLLGLYELDASRSMELRLLQHSCLRRLGFSDAGTYAALAVLGDSFMAWLVRTLRLPAAETHTNLALAICVFLMGLMSVAIIWQAQVIANQQDAIHFLETIKFGG
jgi:hypothetical protein